MKNCPACGGQFEPSRDLRRFCSIECRRGAAQSTRSCAGCGIKFSTFMFDPQRYCNMECYREHQPRGNVPTVVRVCQMCGEAFTMRVSERTSRPGKFCSRSCSGKANGQRAARAPKPRVHKACETCGVEVLVIPSLAERKRFCSVACRAKAGITTSRPRSSKIGDDAIIYWVEHGRFGRDMDWQPELRVSKWLIDLALPEIMLAIELDGVYWHNLPGMAEKDAAKDAGLAAQGWKVCRMPIEAWDTPESLAQAIDSFVVRHDGTELNHWSARILEAS